MSACYKQRSFREREIDVWYLTQWVSTVQFIVSFMFVPVLLLPGFGSDDGASFQQVARQFGDGWDCFLERNAQCKADHAFLLLTGYTLVNVLYNTLGLYLTKVGSAVLNAVSYALLLPITTLLFFTPLVGSVQEHITPAASWTFGGLVGVLLGFALYQRDARRVDKPPIIAALPRQESFQERIIGMGAAHGFGRETEEISRSWSAGSPLVAPEKRARALT